jgi:hypothetical protein
MPRNTPPGVTFAGEIKSFTADADATDETRPATGCAISTLK